ncbi:hypothetical protein B0H12DRAFT_408111 [Mycena haematopus]|nr:hypothetical protein B0H12DRAFT_408111 [Mycena haematopus]
MGSHPPQVQRTPAVARPVSPAKTPARPPSPVKPSAHISPFGAPHPAAQTPRGFGRKSLPRSEVEEPVVREEANDGVTQMEVDAEGYTPVHEDLAAYRVPEASNSDRPAEANAVEPEEKANTPAPARSTRPLAAFMTPQAPRTGFGGPVGGAVGAGGAAVPRYSLGGGAQRVRVEESPWKVRDLLTTNAGAGARATNNATNPFINGGGANVPSTPARRPPLSDAERRAISERRRSALSAPDDFFKGAIPGMSPAKKGAASVLRRVNEDGVMGDASVNAIVLRGEEKEKEDDPRRMLENLRETVEGLKRRRESVLADAGVTVLLTETAENEGKVEFQPQTSGPSGEDQEKQKRRAGARILRGQARGESAHQNQSQLLESEPETTKGETTKGARSKSKEPEASMDVDLLPKPTRRTRKTTPTPAPEASDEEMAQDPAPVFTKPARRSRKPIAEDSDKELTLAVPAAPRRKRNATPTPAVEEEQEQDQGEMTADLVPTPVKPIRRTRKPTAEPESDAEPPSMPSAPMKPRRTRQATVEPDNDAPVPVRRASRKPPSTNTLVPAPAALPATEPEKRRGRTAAKPAPASAPERKGTRGRSRALETEVEEEGDPLDSITETPELELVEVVPPKRRARSAKPKAVKEEEAEPVLEEPARGSRAKKAATGIAVPAVPKPRAGRKGVVPASAPAGVEAGEKENTPGEESEEVAVVKVRVSRSKKVKEEDVEVDAAPRRTRTRTRT